MTNEPDRCPHCHEVLEIEQHGTNFNCSACGADLEAPAETFLELLPVKERPLHHDRGMMFWLLAGGLTILLLLSFSAFEAFIGFQDWRYSRGFKAMAGLRRGWINYDAFPELSEGMVIREIPVCGEKINAETLARLNAWLLQMNAEGWVLVMTNDSCKWIFRRKNAQAKTPVR